LSIFVEKDGKKTLPFSIYIKILVFWSLIGLSAAAMRPLQPVLNNTMTLIRANFIEKIENFTGMKIRYSSIRPTFFGSFDIRNLRLFREETPLFTVSRIRFYFSMPDLLFGKKIIIHTVLIDRPSLRIDTQRDRDLIDLLKSIRSDNNAGYRETMRQIAQFLPERAEYRVRDCFINLTDGETTLQMADIDFNVHGEEAGIFLDGKFSAEFRYPVMNNKTIIVNTGVEINGASSAGLQDGSVYLLLSSLTCSEYNTQSRRPVFLRQTDAQRNQGGKLLFNLRPVSVGLSFDEKTVRMSRSQRNAVFDYDFQYDIETGGITAEINTSGFLPADYISFYDYWKNADHLRLLRITGNSSLRYENGALEYNVNFRGGNQLVSSNTSLLSDAIVIDAYGNEEGVVVNDFLLTASVATANIGLFQGSLAFSGDIGFAPFYPSGTITIDRLSFTGKESVNAVFHAVTEGKEISILGERVSIGNVRFDNLDIYLSHSDRDTDVTVSAFYGGREQIYLNALLGGNPRQIETSLVLDTVSLSTIAELFQPFADIINVPVVGPAYLQDTSISTEIFFSTDFSNIVYNAPNVALRVGDIDGMFSLSGTDKQFKLSEGLLKINESDFIISAGVNFSNPMDLVFSLNAGYHDLAWNVEGQILDGATLIVRDPNGFHVYGNLSNSGAFSGYVEVVDFPILTVSGPAYLNFYITLRYDTGDFWSVDVAYFDGRELNGEKHFRVSGTADQDGASFKDIAYNDVSGMLAGSADFSWKHDFSYFEFLINITDGYEAGEFYFFEGAVADEHVDFRASVSQMRIDRFFKGSGPMFITADAEASWDSIDLFNANVSITSFNARVRNENILASADIIFSNEELFVNDLWINYNGTKARIGAEIERLQFNREEGVVRIGVDIQGITEQRKLEGNIALDVNFRPVASWLEINQVLNSFDGTLLLENIQYGELQQDRFAFVFSGEDGTFSFSGGIKEMIRLEMDREGNFFAGLSAPMPIRGSLIGVFKNGIVDSHFNNFFIDLQSLWDLTPIDEGFNIAGGYITGTIDIRGPFWNPEFFGGGRSSSLRMQVPEFLNEDIRSVPFDVLAEGYEMTFGPVEAVSGAGAGTVGGWFRFENWIPRNVGIDINVPRQSPVPYDLDITGLLANGNASGSLSITINQADSTMELRGDIFANDTAMGVNMDEIAVLVEAERFSNIKLHSIVELTITTGPMVEFIWPNKNNPILRANPEMGTVFYVTCDTRSEQFSINSDVRIRSGELYYFDRNFFIRQAQIVFKENEIQFDPRLNARAELRDRAEEGPVTILLIIDNQPLFSFEPRFESSPALTQLEIYSILGQNLDSIRGYENTDSSRRFLLASTTDLMGQYIFSSDVFSQFVFFRQLERQVRNFLRLDMFNVRTRFFQNAVVTGVTGGDIDRSSRVGNYFDNTTVFIGKYIGQNMFIQGMLKMRYDEDSNLFGGLTFEPDVGIELHSPFVNIRWDFFPYHPENWWVSDNSITLSWSKSF
jgi:hypothetical protein